MKMKSFKLVGFIVTVMMLGFLMTACDTNNGGGGSDIGNGNGGGGGATTGAIRMENNTNRTIVRVALHRGNEAVAVQNFSTNMVPGGGFTINGVPPGNYFVAIFDCVADPFPLPLRISPTLTVNAGQTTTWRAP
ncbi:MAG: hypothetical protein FWD88_07050 [Treponema sp.]|nr:hypothetical protein [Treponema sp.]